MIFVKEVPTFLGAQCTLYQKPKSVRIWLTRYFLEGPKILLIIFHRKQKVK